MQLLFVFLLFFVNLGISWWNAYAVGNVWVESKHAGGYRRFMAWMGALMSGVGFTWSYFIVIGFGAAALGKLDYEGLQLLFDIGYVMIVPVLLFAGYAITFDSWRQAYHQRTLGNMGAAGWNTFATVYNTYNAVQGIGPAAGKIWSVFTKSLSSTNNAQARMVIFVLFLAMIASCLGVITTALLIHHYAGREELTAVRQRVRQSAY